jgi:hypothetical protein
MKRNGERNGKGGRAVSDIDIIFTCQNCREKFGDLAIFIVCDRCQKEIVTTEDIQSALKHSWISEEAEDPEGTKFPDDATEKEIQRYFAGVRRGRETALFWIADFFGSEMISYWEKLAGWDKAR